MEDFASVDFETRAVRKLKVVGAHNYTADPHFSPMCMGWAINHDPVELWKLGDPFPKPLRRHIERGGKMHAWHAMFERLVWNRAMARFVEVERRQWRCTMVRALACGFPGSLEWAAKALRLTERKDMAGSKAMSKLSKPRKVIDGKPIWWDYDEFHDVYKKMYAYCKQDVVTERAAGDRLPLLPRGEDWQFWFDQVVADRGVVIDTDLCRAAIKITEQRREELAERSRAICGFSPTQAVLLRQWVNKRGVPIPDVKKDTIDSVLSKKNISNSVRTVLEYRREGAMSSVSKYKKALHLVMPDKTIKGARQFYGAHTSRWAGRGVQLDNLKRVPKGVDIDEMVDIVLTGELDMIESSYGSVMEPVSNSVRSMIVAPEGEALYVADLKSIESRMLSSTTGQESTNKQWRLSDQGKGADVYEKNGAEIFNIPLDKVTKDERYWGKIAELLLGYEGGTVPLLRQQEKADVRFREIYPTLHRLAENHIRDKVHFLWRKMGKKGNNNEKDWKAARYMVEKWRANNPMTVKFWKRMMKISVAAMQSPGEVKTYRGISFQYDRHYKMLICKTMNGGELRYPFPRVVKVLKRNKSDQFEWQLRARYQHPKIKRFVEYHPYGGMLTENIIQHQARAVMAGRFKPLEAAKFKVRHTVHDETISTSRPGRLQEYKDILEVSPSWAPDCPIAVEAWAGVRYKKED